eukprot:m.161506 g.161506  ORF g.161506 m.161506 type:complete len:510 (+) comp9866_c0_seq3:95-1624(+)
MEPTSARIVVEVVRKNGMRAHIECEPSLASVTRELHALFPKAARGLRYIDDEGDAVRLDSEDDLAEAMRIMARSCQPYLRVVFDGAGDTTRKIAHIRQKLLKLEEKKSKLLARLNVLEAASAENGPAAAPRVPEKASKGRRGKARTRRDATGEDATRPRPDGATGEGATRPDAAHQDATRQISDGFELVDATEPLAQLPTVVLDPQCFFVPTLSTTAPAAPERPSGTVDTLLPLEVSTSARATIEAGSCVPGPVSVPVPVPVPTPLVLVHNSITASGPSSATLSPVAPSPSPAVPATASKTAAASFSVTTVHSSTGVSSASTSTSATAARSVAVPPLQPVPVSKPAAPAPAPPQSLAPKPVPTANVPAPAPAAPAVLGLPPRVPMYTPPQPPAPRLVPSVLGLSKPKPRLPAADTPALPQAALPTASAPGTHSTPAPTPGPRTSDPSGAEAATALSSATRSAQLDALFGMGYFDRALNARVLDRCGGSLVRALDELKAHMDNDWHERRH